MVFFRVESDRPQVSKPRYGSKSSDGAQKFLLGPIFPALASSFATGPSKTTRAYLHSEEKVVAALEANGFVPQRRDLTATSFYFSRVIEARRRS